MLISLNQLIKGPRGPGPPKHNTQDSEEEIKNITGHAWRSLQIYYFERASFAVPLITDT